MNAIVADTNPVYRFGLSTLVKALKQFHYVHEVESISQLEINLEEEAETILLIDIFFDREKYTKYIKDLINTHHSLKVILVLRENYSIQLSEVQDCGALGFILRISDKSEIFTAIDKACKNEPFLSPTIVKLLANQNFSSNGHLSKTFELNLLSIMFLMFHEKSSKEIASICNLSCRTVEDYRKKILRLTNSVNMVGIIKYVVERNIHNNEYLILKFGKYCLKKNLQEIDFIR